MAHYFIFDILYFLTETFCSILRMVVAELHLPDDDVSSLGSCGSVKNKICFPHVLTEVQQKFVGKCRLHWPQCVKSY